ncbi:helix-turn-helix domain-containing protein [Streptomyces sannanensis]|uniref:Helix-turn-helix domain-containing protein n=1 Tax=Streptomyces sannanensis TaxID=285536 RepID=A0ABP6S9E1_9ACTN
MTHTAQVPTSSQMTRQELLELPLTVSMETAARALGIGKSKAYGLLRSGEFPVRTLKLGSVVKVPTAALWEVLGVTPHP